MNKIKRIVENNVLYIFILLCTMFAVPSIIYYIRNKSLLGFEQYYRFSLVDINSVGVGVIDALCFIILFLAITFTYLLIVKRRNTIFKNLKQIILFVLLILLIFAIIIPFTSSDIYYYIGSGWLEHNYGENPYYSTIFETNVKDEMFANVSDTWADTTVVYGPIWSIICKLLVMPSFGNLTIALIIFKLAGVILHILNCIIINKITQKNIFVLLYGLNPFVLFEVISNVHNDIYIVFFILLALYFLIKRKNIFLSVAFLAIASSIKYFAILLLPFILIYKFRDKKLYQKILYCILYGCIFLLIYFLSYMIYAKDINIIFNMMEQQKKISQSLFIILDLLSNKFNDYSIFYVFRIIFIFGFAYILIINIFTYIKGNKKPKLSNLLRIYNSILLIFIFFILTNFKVWYIIWLFPTLMWQKSNIIKNIISISIISEISLMPFFIHNSDSYMIGVYNVIIFIVLFIWIYSITNQKKKLKRADNLLK